MTSHQALHAHLLELLGVDSHEAAGAEIGRLHALARDAAAKPEGGGEALTLPVNIHGETYDVPIPVQLRIVHLEMKLDAALATPPPSSTAPEAVQLASMALTTAGVAHYVSANGDLCITARPALQDRDGLDFEPDEQHTVADMANVGYSLMQAIKEHRPGYSWNETPAEIVRDLLKEIEEAQQPAVQGEREGYVLVHESDLIEEDDYGVHGSQFYRCNLCGSESGAGLLNKGIKHEESCPLTDVAGAGADDAS